MKIYILLIIGFIALTSITLIYETKMMKWFKDLEDRIKKLEKADEK